jgi:uncharacterized membrane protein AbrB (regulator of aidB expression)
MTLLLLRIIASTWLTVVIMKAAILESPRKWVSPKLPDGFLECPLCVGFWCSVVAMIAPAWAVTLASVAGGAYVAERFTDKFLPCLGCSRKGRKEEIKIFPAA